MSFCDRAEGMGLTNLGEGCFFYGDIHGEVVYRTLKTKGGNNIMENMDIPYLALYTKEPGVNPLLKWEFCGVLSDSYKFEGNEVINETIRRAIQSIGQPIFKETTIITPYRTQMHNMMIIAHPTNHQITGDIYPQITVTNSYNGTRAKGITFGIYMSEGEIDFGFRTKLGELRQVHHESHNTTLATPISGYVEIFAQDISRLIETNFSIPVTEEDLLRTLELVEKIGKQKRNIISNRLQEMATETNNPLNNWQLFLALTTYSSIEPNLNAKRLLENVAERVLIVPERMMHMAQTLG